MRWPAGAGKTTAGCRRARASGTGCCTGSSMPAPAARSAGGALRKSYKPLAMELQYPRPMLSKKPRLPDPDAIALPPIGDDPAYQAALVELVALERRRAEIEQRRKTRQGKAARGKDGPQRAGEGARFAGRRHRRPGDPIDDIKAADEEEFRSCGRRSPRRRAGWTTCTAICRSPPVKRCNRNTPRRCGRHSKQRLTSML